MGRDFPGNQGGTLLCQRECRAGRILNSPLSPNSSLAVGTTVRHLLPEPSSFF